MLGLSMEDSLRQNKLCGFFCVVLAVNSPQECEQGELCEALEFGTRCFIFGNGADVGFRTENGVVLSLVRGTGGDSAMEMETKDNCGVLNEDLGKGQGFEGECRSSRTKRRRIGLVHGSMSAVVQLHALKMHKCLEFVARVVRVLVRENKDARAVVLIDVYLPLALWSGWQFPRSGSTAAALFRHLSCDWKERNSTLLGEWQYCKYANQDEETIWKLSDCHVFKCKVHRSALGISRRKLFELHEIFKNLPVLGKEGKTYSTTIKPEDESLRSGIWEVSDDVLTNILMALSPVDLVRVAATCRHLRSLAVMVMPCMKLKLFPHQQAAVEWMLHREHNIGVLPHPLYMNFLTEDGFPLYINSVTGEIVTGIAPTIRDFRGGLFCDEPGLGKTITAISLILKTLGTLADPPDGIEVIWCMHNFEKKCGYYEISSSKLTPGNVTSSLKRLMDTRGQRGCLLPDMFPPGGNSKSSTKRGRSLCYESDEFVTSADSCSDKLGITSSTRLSTPKTRVFRCAKSLNRVKRNLLETYDADFSLSERTKSCNSSNKRKHIASNPRHGSLDNFSVPSRSMYTFSKPREVTANNSECNETWVQCDACRKWRKLSNTSIPDATAVWFCSMNMDPLHQKCSAPEESWDLRQPITILPGFSTKGTPGGTEQNVSFFTSVLKEHCTLINSETKKALTWLAKLSQDKLSEMETVGLARPVFDTVSAPGGDACGYHKIFQSFGLVRRIEKEKSRWYYPQPLDNLSFDLAALQIALTKPLDSFRLYLSRATLIVVPANLVDHWLTQIQKHVRPGQLRVFVWTDNKKPRAHNLAWDNDIVITTFNRLSAEWGPRKRSVLMQVHWLRVMLDEGHTLGSSLNLTNKLQMAISLTASNRWLLTGTPTPNTPNSQVSHLQPMLKFLHEEAYGQDEKSWEAGIFRPFEAEMQEGRSRLLQLLHRCMISARKIDLHTIPPCIKKVTFLNFNEEHAKSYNELVVTVQRNILMADWNDPSHVESLLNPKQWKFRSNTIRNVRLSCCVAGHIKVTDAGQDIQETMDILAEQGLDHSSEEYASIKYYLINGGNCFRCSEWCRLPVITPCRHLLCLDCIALDSEKCTFPGCGNLYEMQSPEILTRPENPNPKWPVPKDLIELQPSYKQDDWDPDWQATSSSKVSYLIERLKALQAVDRKMICLIDGNDDARHRDGLHWTSQKVPQLQEPCCKTTSESCNISAEKVIIFSQFLEHIHVIEEQLKVAGIKFAGMYSPMHSINKMKSLANFQHDATCMALLMDGSAALGLDLSFVTHVFLMEPIWDRSMEEQVISRAHRMGATRPIHVETLAMRGTIEEQMVEFLQDAYECRRKLKVECGRNDREGARVRRTLHDFAESNYLSQLSFVRTNAKT